MSLVAAVSLTAVVESTCKVILHLPSTVAKPRAACLQHPCVQRMQAQLLRVPEQAAHLRAPVVGGQA